MHFSTRLARYVHRTEFGEGIICYYKRGHGPLGNFVRKKCVGARRPLGTWFFQLGLPAKKGTRRLGWVNFKRESKTDREGEGVCRTITVIGLLKCSLSFRYDQLEGDCRVQTAVVVAKCSTALYSSMSRQNRGGGRPREADCGMCEHYIVQTITYYCYT